MLKSNEKIEPIGEGLEIIVSNEHTFGTDAVLLADFASPKKYYRAVDMGTGCGIIPMLWCRGDSPKSVIGVEIQENAVNMAQRTIEMNNLQQRFKIVNTDLREIKGDFEGGNFDLVTCNPPYKPLTTGIVNPEYAKMVARHESMCTIEDVTKTAAKLLRYGGKICLCQRPERLMDIMQTMRDADLEPKRLRFVHHRQDKQPSLFLIEGRRGGNIGLTVLPPLIMEEKDGSKSAEINRINKSYNNA